MKSLKFARLAAIAAVATLSSAAFAGTGTVNVSAALAGQCKFTSVGAMSFTLDPSVVAAASSNVTAVTYKCTKNTVAGAFSVGGQTGGTYLSGTTAATGALKDATATSADLLQLQVDWTAPGAFTGDGFGTGSTGTTVNLQGSIAHAQFANAAPATYTGTVAIQILP